MTADPANTNIVNTVQNPERISTINNIPEAIDTKNIVAANACSVGHVSFIAKKDIIKITISMIGPKYTPPVTVLAYWKAPSKLVMLVGCGNTILNSEFEYRAY